MHLPIPEVFGVGVAGYGDACRLNPKAVQYNLGLNCVGAKSMTWKRVVTLEVCALAPSCINTKPEPISCAKGGCGSAQILQHTSRLLSSPNENEVSLVVQGNSSPNHQWSSDICNSLQQVRRQISFSSMPPHPDTTICPRKQVSGFIRKHYWGPI